MMGGAPAKDVERDREDLKSPPLSARDLSRELSLKPSAETKTKTAATTDARTNSAKLGAGKLISILDSSGNDSWFISGHGSCCLQKTSIYGAAIALPQIARSCDWPGTFCAVVLRTYFFTVLNFLLQASLLSMIGEEFNLWFLFAGQMHLCDFGRSIQDCPDATNCIGPLGTNFSYPRLYNFGIWSTRTFVQQSLEVVAPFSDVSQSVDPGEYGLENFYCRIACISLFLLSTMTDLLDSVDNIKTLVLTPTKAESWIQLKQHDWAHKDAVKDFHDHGELDLVLFQVAGMPLHWKLLNAIFILLPKCLLWLGVTRSGVHYLMETAGIMDVVVNAMALSFVLNVDEMIFSSLSSSITNHIMENLEPLEEEPKEEADEVTLRRFEEEELRMSCIRILWKIMPVQFMLLMVMLLVFVADYYYTNCVSMDGSLVSKAMHLPAQLHGNSLRFMFGIEAPQEPEAFWTMPS